MSATAAARVTIANDDAPESAKDAAVKPVTVFVRFSPNASVFEVSHLPAHLTGEQWVKLLHTHAGDRYQSRAGGRGFFQISPDELARLQALPPL